jgi:hypothetical protein
MAHFGAKSILRARIGPKSLDLGVFGQLLGPLAFEEGEVHGFHGCTVGLHDDLYLDRGLAKL